MGFLSKLLRLLLKVTKVTTGHLKLPKIGKNSIISSFFARRARNALAEGQSPQQELEVGPRSEPYLLAPFKSQITHQSVIAIFINHHTDGETVTTLSARLEVIITRRTK